MELKRKYQKSRGKRLLRRVSLTLSILFIIIFLFLLFFSLPPGEKIIRNLVQNKLTAYLDLPVHIGSLQTNIFSQLQITQVRIDTKYDSLFTPLLKIKQLDVSYSVWALLKKEVEINSLSVSGMQVHLVLRENGTYNLPTAFTSRPKETSSDTLSKGFRFKVNEFNLEQAAFYYTDKKADRDVSIEGLSLYMKQTKDKTYRFQMIADSGGVDFDTHKIPLSEFLAQGQFRSGSLQLDTVRMNLPDASLHGHMSVDMAGSPSKLTGQFHLTVSTATYSSLFRNSIPADFYPVQSDLAADIILNGELKRPEIHTTLRFNHGRLGTRIPFTAVMAVIYSPPVLDLQSFNLKIFEGNISGNGTVHLDSLYNHHFTMALEKLSLNTIHQLISQKNSLFAGNIGGKLKTDGPLKKPLSISVQSNISITRVSYKSRPIADFDADIRLANKTFSVNIQQGSSRLDGKFSLQNQNINGKYSADIRQIRPFVILAGIPELGGAIHFSGTVSGETKNPDVSMSFRGDSISYRNLPLDAIEGSLSYQHKELLFHNTIFSGELSGVDSLNPPLHLTGLSGGLSYYGSVQGTLKNPVAELNVSLQNIYYKKSQLARAELNLALDSQKVYLKPSYLKHDSLGILLEGNYEWQQSRGILGVVLTGKNIPGRFTVPLDFAAENSRDYPLGIINSRFNFSDSSDWKITVTSHHLDLTKITELYPLNLPIAGSTGFNLNFSGGLSHPRAKLNFELNSFQYKDAEFDSIRGALVLSETDLDLDSLVAFTKGEQSKIKGRIEVMHSSTKPVYISKRSHVTIQAEGNHLNLELLEPFLPADTKINGFISYSVQVSGRIYKPDISGEVEISNGAFLINPWNPGFDKISLKMTFKDSLFTLQTLQGRYLQTLFQMEGQFITIDWHHFQTEFQLRAAGKEAVKITGNLSTDSLQMRLDVNNLELSVVQPFVPGITELKGEMNANVVIHGAFNNPLLFGQLKLNKLKFNQPGLNEAITQGKMSISLNRHTVQLDSLSAKLNGGIAKASGKISLDHYKLTDVNLSTSLFKIPINRPDLFTVLIDTAKLTYQRKGEFYNLNGDVWLGKSQYTHNFEPQEIIQSLRSAQGPTREQSDLEKKTKLNVRLLESKNLWVDNNLAKIQLSAALEFIGTLARPNMTGRVQVEKGYVMYLDRKFQVDTAVVDFVDPNKLNPIVNLKAVSQVTVYERQQSTAYEITLSITGPLDQPVVDLTSNPPLNKSDILSVLTLGTTTENLLSSSASGTSVTNVLTRRVESLSSQRITSYLSNRVGNLLGLDQVTIEGNIFRFNQGGAPQLVATKTFLNRLAVTYSTTVGHLNDQGVRLDYHISKHWAIQGETNQMGEAGIDLKYQINFK